MRRARVLALAAAALIGTGAAVAGIGDVAGAAPAGTVICDQYGSAPSPDGRYIVQNNRWGTSAEQCITLNQNGFALTTSNANVPTNGAPASYPSIYWGCHYGNCTPGFNPIQASSAAFAGISTSVGMTYPGSGQWDAAYDIWFDPTARRDGQNTGAEIMVWLNHAGAPQPVGSRVATVSLAGGTWDVWEGNIGWNVVSYVRTSGTGSLSFAPNTFFADAVARGYASPPDAAQLPRFERLAGRRAIHLRPALRLERTVEADPRRIREALASLLEALDEPPLPVASPA